MGKAGRWFKGLLGIKKEPKQIESSAEKEGKEGSIDSSAKPSKHRQRRWSFGVKASAVSGDHQHPNEDGTKEPKLSSGNYNFGGSERAKAGTNKQILAPRSSASAVPYPITSLDSDVVASSAPLSTSTTTTSAPPPTSSSSSSATQSKETIVAISHTTAKGVPMKGDEGFSEEEEIGAIRIQTAFRGYLARKALNALRGLVKLQALVRGHIVRKQAKETLKCMHALVKIQTQITANRAKILEIGHHGSLQRRPNDQRRRLHDGSESSSQDENWRREMDMSRSRCGAPRKKGLMAGAMSDSYCTNPSTSSTADSYRIPSPQRQRQHRLSRVAVPRPQSTDLASSQEYDNEVADTGYLDGTESVYSTFQNSPVSKHSRMNRGPLRSEYAESLIDGYAGFPSYMANTQSSRAKVRSQSAPRQRPSTSSQSSASRKRMTIHETSDGARMQRSSSQVPPLRKGLNYHGGSTGSQMNFDNRSVISIRDDDYDTMSLVSGRF